MIIAPLTTGKVITRTAKKYRGHCNLDGVSPAIATWRPRKTSRVERLRAEGLNIPVGHDVSDLADWECHLLFG